MNWLACSIFSLILSCALHPVSCDVLNNEIEECNLSADVKKEIHGYKHVVDKIIGEVLDGQFKGSTYKHLADVVDLFGNRLSGSEALEGTIDYIMKLSKDANLDNVHGEEVTVPHWIRGNESAVMLEPFYQPLPMLGLGSTIGTPPEGIKAEAVVVSSFDELDKLGTKVKGKIVVYNQEFITYGISVQYRGIGADKASSYGAVAALIRSITPFSMNTPHTGLQHYWGNVTQIPAACITVEDAHMLHRRYLRGEKIVIEIKMGAQNLPPKTSRNTIVDIKGREQPKNFVLISGHLDSWDVGDGAMDDGAAAIMSWNSLVILNSLKLRPRRTLRAVLWTGEEEGLIGAFAYADRHKNDSMNFVMESDIGTFTPQGLEYMGPKEGACILQEILQLFGAINATRLVESQDVGSDIIAFLTQGIPGASLLNDNDRYFWFHHSPADTIDIEDPDTLDKCTALWAAVSYIISDLSFDMPRK